LKKEILEKAPRRGFSGPKEYFPFTSHAAIRKAFPVVRGLAEDANLAPGTSAREWRGEAPIGASGFRRMRG